MHYSHTSCLITPERYKHLSPSHQQLTSNSPMHMHPSKHTTGDLETGIIVFVLVVCTPLLLLAIGHITAVVVLLCWKSHQTKHTQQDTSQYATVYCSKAFYDSLDNKANMGGSKENIYDCIDEVSIREVEGISGEPSDSMGVPQDTIKLSSDTVEVTHGTVGEALDAITDSLDAGGIEGDYQEITELVIQSSTYAHLYSSLPLHQGGEDKVQNQNEIDVPKWDGQDTAVERDGPDTAVERDGEEEGEENRDKQETP